LADHTYGRVYGTKLSVCLSGCNASIVAERYVAGVGDSTVRLIGR